MGASGWVGGSKRMGGCKRMGRWEQVVDGWVGASRWVGGCGVYSMMGVVCGSVSERVSGYGGGVVKKSMMME